MASACLPLLFRAVEIDGVPYWDGGYLGNPIIFPFFRTTTTEDVLVVQINPLMRQATPTSSSEIINRINEITFNSSLIGEYRAIEFVARLIDQGSCRAASGPDNTGASTCIASCSIVSAPISMLSAGSRPITIISRCCTISGKCAAQRFMDEHFDDIGVKSTVDLRAEAQAEWA